MNKPEPTVIEVNFKQLADDIEKSSNLIAVYPTYDNEGTEFTIELMPKGYGSVSGKQLTSAKRAAKKLFPKGTIIEDDADGEITLEIETPDTVKLVK